MCVALLSYADLSAHFNISRGAARSGARDVAVCRARGRMMAMPW